MDGGGDLIGEDETEEIGEVIEVGVMEMGGMGVFICVKGISTPNIDGIGEGAGGSALAHGLKGFEEMSGGKGNVRDIGVIGVRLSVREVVIGNVGREEVVNMGFESGRIRSQREGRGDDFESGVKVVFVSGKLGGGRKGMVVEVGRGGERIKGRFVRRRGCVRVMEKL
jgi:hypothetical protein